MIAHSKSKCLALCFSTLLGCSLAACGGVPEERSDTDLDQQDPPGAAQALSLGAEVESDESEFEVAVKCAAALRITATTLSLVSSQANSDVLGGVRRAAGIFERKASEAQEGRSADRAIARLERENAEDRGGQARAAIGCIRRLDNGTASVPDAAEGPAEEG